MTIPSSEEPARLWSSPEDTGDPLSELQFTLFAAESASVADLEAEARPADLESADLPDPSELCVLPELASASLAGCADVDAMFKLLCAEEEAVPREPGADSTIGTMLGELLVNTGLPEQDPCPLAAEITRIEAILRNDRLERARAIMAKQRPEVIRR
jgi:hypothetical protein